MYDVTLPRFPVFWPNIGADYADNSIHEFINGYALSATDISYSCSIVFCSQDHRFNNISYIREVSRLLSVTIYDGRITILYSLDETWNNGGILRIGILSWTEDIEKPETDCR